MVEKCIENNVFVIFDEIILGYKEWLPTGLLIGESCLTRSRTPATLSKRPTPAATGSTRPALSRWTIKLPDIGSDSRPTIWRFSDIWSPTTSSNRSSISEVIASFAYIRKSGVKTTTLTETSKPSDNSLPDSTAFSLTT